MMREFELAGDWMHEQIVLSHQKPRSPTQFHGEHEPVSPANSEEI